MTAAKSFSTKKHLRAVLKYLADGIVVQDMNANIVYINESAAHQLGFPNTQAALAAGRPHILRQFKLYDEHGRPLPIEMLPGREALHGAPEPARIIRAKAAGASESAWRWAWVKASSIENKNHQVEYVVTVFQEITSFKNAEIGAVEANQRIMNILEDVLKHS